MHKAQTTKFGLTLIELLVSIAIIAVVVVLVTSGFNSFRESSQLNEVHSVILGILRDARSRTLSSEKNTEYGVHFESARTILFSGEAFNLSSFSNEVYNFPPLSRISSINFGGPTDVVFARLTGTASVSGTITIESIQNSEKTKIITILASGVVE